MRTGRPIEEMQSNVLLSPRGETLMIPKAIREDAGDYSCVVTNTAGSVEAPFIVVVQTGPHFGKFFGFFKSTLFLDEPIDQNPQAIEKSEVVLSCPVLGAPTPKVTWKHLDKDLGLTADGKYQLDGKSNLKISNITVNFKNFVEW